MKIFADQVSATEALNLIRGSKESLYPKCHTVLAIAPDIWRPGDTLHAVFCRCNQNHFYLRCQDTYARKEARV